MKSSTYVRVAQTLARLCEHLVRPFRRCTSVTIATRESFISVNVPVLIFALQGGDTTLDGDRTRTTARLQHRNPASVADERNRETVRRGPSSITDCANVLADGQMTSATISRKRSFSGEG